MPRLTINGSAVDAPEGATVLEAARLTGIRIPTLCFLQGQPPIGACRVCLVEIEGQRDLGAACSLPVVDGMRVHTHTPRVRKAITSDLAEEAGFEPATRELTVRRSTG